MLQARLSHWALRLRVACCVVAWALLALAYLLPSGIASLDVVSARAAELNVAPIVALTGWLVSRLMMNGTETRSIRVIGAVLCATALLAWALAYAFAALIKFAMLL